MAYLIEEMFAVKERKDCEHACKDQTALQLGQEKAKHGKEIKFSLNDKFSERKLLIKPCWQAMYKCFGWKFEYKKFLSKSEYIYQKGYDKVVKELDIIHILKTMHKVNAGVAAVVENDSQLMKLSRDIYLNHTTLFSDTDDERR